MGAVAALPLEVMAPGSEKEAAALTPTAAAQLARRLHGSVARALKSITERLVEKQRVTVGEAWMCVTGPRTRATLTQRPDTRTTCTTTS